MLDVFARIELQFLKLDLLNLCLLIIEMFSVTFGFGIFLVKRTIPDNVSVFSNQIKWLFLLKYLLECSIFTCVIFLLRREFCVYTLILLVNGYAFQITIFKSRNLSWVRAKFKRFAPALLIALNFTVF